MQRQKTNSSPFIAMVSDLTYGGAAIACSRLKKGLVNAGRKVVWYAREGMEGKGAIVIGGRMSFGGFLTKELCRRFIQSPRRLQWWNDRCADISMVDQVQRGNPGVVNLHNIHDGLSFGLARRLGKGVPIVWTLHDMWPLTGYCCYSYDCKKYVNGCEGDCPQDDLWGPMVASQNREWQRRHSFLQKNINRMVFVTPSQWMAGCARERFPPGSRVEVIPNGLPLEVFRPVAEKRAIRQVLGLPTDCEVVLCNSHNSTDPRKGSNLLREAVCELAARFRKRICIVSLGACEKKGEGPRGVFYTGTIRDETLVNLYYNAADVFAAPSLADNLPNTLVESMAAGTPGVTFAVGGCAEVVRHGETGFVAGSVGVAELADSIGRVIGMSSEQRKVMGLACRSVAEREYSQALQAQRYGKLFDELSRGAKREARS